MASRVFTRVAPRRILTVAAVSAVALGSWTMRPAAFAAKKSAAAAPGVDGEHKAPISGLDAKEFRPFTVKKIKKVTHDSRLYNIEVPNLGPLPVSSYVVVKETVDGKEEKRPYTPVLGKDGELNLLIKSYPTGKVSKSFGEKKIGDKVEIIGPMKSRPYTPNEFKNIVMVAGGTGGTPMLQLVHTILDNPDDKTKVHLLFANHTPEDILMKEEWDKLASKKPDQFSVTYIVSKGDSNWKGPTGRINQKQVKESVVARAPPSSSSLVYVCGPPGFMETVSGPKTKDYKQGELSGLLKEAGYDANNVWKF